MEVFCGRAQFGNIKMIDRECCGLCCGYTVFSVPSPKHNYFSVGR